MVPPLYCRLIARWRHGRWCLRCGKGPYFYSTRGPTGSLLVITEVSAATKRLKRNKAPVNGTITADVLKGRQGTHRSDVHQYVQQVPQRKQTPKQLEKCFGDLNTQER